MSPASAFLTGQSRAARTKFIIGLLVAAGFLRLFLSVDMPTVIRAYLVVDDALFVRLAEEISSGRWLGDFNSSAIVKGPGYSFFLVFGHMTGLPITLISGLFQVFSVAMFGYAVFRLTQSRLGGIFVFALLLFFPSTYSSDVTAINRTLVYWPQALLILAFVLLAMSRTDDPRKCREWLTLSGLIFGWFCVTREEGIWLVPTLVLLIAYVLYTMEGSWPDRIKAGGAFAIAAVLPLVLVSFFNLVAYGTFVVTDWNGKDMKRVLYTLQRVESPNRQPLLAIPQDVRLKAYEVSPALAEIQPLIDPPAPAIGSFSNAGCRYYPRNKPLCGDIVSGWLPWAIRNSMDKLGHYTSPKRANAYLKRVADDLEAACDTGALTCTAPNGFAGLPAMGAGEWQRVAESTIRKFFRSLGARPDYPSLSEMAANATTFWGCGAS